MTRCGPFRDAHSPYPLRDRRRTAADYAVSPGGIVEQLQTALGNLDSETVNTQPRDEMQALNGIFVGLTRMERDGHQLAWHFLLFQKESALAQSDRALIAAEDEMGLLKSPSQAAGTPA